MKCRTALYAFAHDENLLVDERRGGLGGQEERAGLELTFKENCPNIRNTRVIDIVKELQGYNALVDVYDPWADAGETGHEYGIDIVAELKEDYYDAIILAVGHQQFRDMGTDRIRNLAKTNSALFDVKCILPRDAVDEYL